MPSPNKYAKNDPRRLPVLKYEVRKVQTNHGLMYYAFFRTKFMFVPYWRRIGVWPTQYQAAELCKQHARQLGHKALIK